MSDIGLVLPSFAEAGGCHLALNNGGSESFGVGVQGLDELFDFIRFLVKN